MWHKEYRDYGIDKALIKYQVQPGKGIIGCEMHEINGWGNTLHIFSKNRFANDHLTRLMMENQYRRD